MIDVEIVFLACLEPNGIDVHKEIIIGSQLNKGSKLFYLFGFCPDVELNKIFANYVDKECNREMFYE